MTLANLARHPDARRVRKRPVAVPVEFAASAGTIDTLEGAVRHEAGAAILTGAAGERWPVERAKFDAAYEPAQGIQAGQPGAYRKRPVDVLARQLTEEMEVPVGASASMLKGQPGDWLVQYGWRDFGIVAKAIFEQTYDVLGPVRVRVRRPYKQVLEIGAPIAAVSVVVLGAIGFWIGVEGGKRDSAQAALLHGAQLLVLNVPPEEIKHWLSWTAALVAPFVLAAAAISAFGAQANRWRERFGLIFRPATDVFLGGGDTATGLATRRQQTGNKLAALDLSEEAALDQAMAAFKVKSFLHVGDALLRDALRPFQLHRSKNVWIATGDDQRNLEVARRAMGEIQRRGWKPSRHPLVARVLASLRPAPGKPREPVRVLVNVYDRRLTRVADQLFPRTLRGGAVLEFFSMPRLAARTLLAMHPPRRSASAPAPHLLVVGGHELAAALVVHAAQHLVYSETPTQCVRISLVGQGSLALYERLLREYPALVPDSEAPSLKPLLPLARIEVCECDETAFRLDDWHRLQRWGGAFDAVYVACERDALTAAAATRLAALSEVTWHDGTPAPDPLPIVACLQQPPGSLCSIYPDVLAPRRQLAGQSVHWFDVFEACLREDEDYPGQQQDHLAMLVKLEYVDKLTDRTTHEEARAAWHQEVDEFRWSNRLAADHIAIKCAITPQLKAAPLPDGSDALERLCRLEHRRFVAERLLEGWLPTPDAAMNQGPSGLPPREKKTALRINPTLMPFDALPPTERRKDEKIVQATPLILSVIDGWKSGQRPAGDPA